MKPAKILSDRSWTDIMRSPDYDGEDKFMPVTQSMAKDFVDIVTGPADIQSKIYGGTMAGVGVLAAPFVDTIGAAGNAVLNGYKRLYNYGADAANTYKLRKIDKQIKEFQRNNPNNVSNNTMSPEVWESIHKFGPQNREGYVVNGRTIYQKLRYKKKPAHQPQRISL